MLKLTNVNKYFNRFKKNEIHVINDTSLELEDNGLVALLGPSGCGKTTLLNAIGGLDKVSGGKIFIDGKRITRRSSGAKDKLRVLNIGYIFQDYNLLDNLSVFENVAMSLRMIGIKNKKEVKRRVEYVLTKVGMYRYRNKPAGMLSGGERQRVGIARAIVKNPSIIIADEPTGNLDSKNTIEIMNIIKSISKNKLVILVTHERDLAYFYASRIVNLEDGKVVSDNDNNHENELDYRIDNKIYLKDFKNHETIEEKGHDLNFYYDTKEKMNLDIVIRNGNIYIKSNTAKKIEIVDDSSSIEFIDDNYKKISKEDYEKYNFDMSEIDNSHRKLHYSSIYNIFTMFKTGFKKVGDYTFMKKILLVGFFMSAMFIVYAISNIFGVTDIKDENFVSINKNYITVKNAGNKVNDYLKLVNDENIGYVLPGDSLISFKIVNNELYQLSQTSLSVGGSMSSINLITSNDLIKGTMPQNEYEIVVDKFAINNIIIGEEYQMVGLKTIDKFIGQKVKINNLYEFTITGISDTGSPSIYLSESNFMNILTNSPKNDGWYEDPDSANKSVKDYNLYSDKITLRRGNLPTNDYEVIVNIDNRETYPLNKTINTTVNGQKLKVVGYYYSQYGDSSIYSNSNTVMYEYILSTSDLVICSDNMEEDVTYLQNAGYNATDSYTSAKEEYEKGARDFIMQSCIIAGILLAISFIEIFLMIRASFMSRIKEVGIYRAVGVKKSDVYKMFLGEILVITTLAGVPGFILMSAILNEISKIKYLSGLYIINPQVLIISIILIYGLNIIIGLLPIKSTIRKTPAAILSRNDVD